MKENIATDLSGLTIPIESIHLDPANVREGHDLQAIADSLHKYGQRKPIVVNSANDMIEAGNGTYQAAKVILGWQNIAAVMVKDDPQTATGYAIADNRTGDLSSFNLEALDLTLQSFDMPEEIPGIEADFLEELRLEVHGPEPVKDVPPQIDKAAELQEKWQVKRGDLWQLGDHKLLCGDCRNPDDVAKLVDGEKANGVFTSPPYAEQRKKQYGGVPVAEYVEWWEAVQENMRGVLTEDGSFFVNIKPHCEDGQRVLYVMDLALAMVRQWGWRLVEELCWVRNGVPKIIKERFRNAFEPVYHFAGKHTIRMNADSVMMPPSDVTIKRLDFAVRSGETNEGRQYSKKGGFSTDWATTQSMRDGVYPDNVLQISAEVNPNIKHAAAFPIKLPTFFIKAYSDPGDIWLDPFCGSGTTIMACENEGRVGYGIELLEKYCSAILERYLDLAGCEPELLTN